MEETGESGMMGLDELLEDTPIFRERVEYLEGHAQFIKHEIKDLIAQANLYSKAGIDYAEAGRAFAAKTDEISKVIPALQNVASGLKALHYLIHQMHTQISSDLMAPLEQMLSDVKQSKQAKTAMEQAADNYYASLNKTLSIKADADEKTLHEVDRECMRRKGRYDLSRLEFMGKLSDISSGRRHQTMTFYSKLVDSQVRVLRSGLDLLQESMPALVDVEADGIRVQKEVNERQDMRLQLITSHIEEQEALRRHENHVSGADRSLVPRDSQGEGGMQKQKKLANTTEMRGWLRKPHGNKHKDARQHRYWSVLSCGKLYLYRDWRSSPKYVFDLLLCTVREVRQTERFYFEIVSPQVSRILQADNQMAMEAWMTVIQNATSKMLDSQVPSASRDGQGAGSSRSLALRLVGGNQVCSDCGADDPEWASVSLGVLFCVNCSGIHRKMGVHVSRVRSLTLDVWEDSLVQMMTELGNERVNLIMMSKYAHNEGLAPEIGPDSKSEDREAHIRKKYDHKAFIRKDIDASQVANELQEGLSRKDLPAVLKAIVLGADVNQPLDGEDRVTPLMQAVHEDFVAGLELLYHSGADVDVKDSLGRTALHHSAMMDARITTEVLLQRGARSDVRDHYGKTALEVAAIAPGGVAFEVIVRSKGLKVGQEDDQGGSPGSSSPTNLSRGASPVHQPMPHDAPPPLPLEEKGASYSVSAGSAETAPKTTPHHRRGISWSGTLKGLMKEGSADGSTLTVTSASDLSGVAASGAQTAATPTHAEKKSRRYTQLGKLMKGLSHLKPGSRSSVDKD